MTPQTFYLERQGTASFHCSNIAELAAHFVNDGWLQLAPRSPYEFQRLARDGRLLVVYLNGTVLIQGKEQAETIALLERFIEVPF